MRFSPLALLALAFHALATACAPSRADAPGLGFEVGELGEPPADWIVTTEDWEAELTDARPAEGRLCAKFSGPGGSMAPFGCLMRTIDAKEYRGHHVELRAKIRVEGESGRGQMWLRVDLPDGGVGAFDNMDDRPIFTGDWSEAVIEADVDANALELVLGFRSMGGATLFIDSVELNAGVQKDYQEPSPPRELTPRGLENLSAATRLLAYVRFFHPSDQAVGVESWGHFAVHLMEEAEPARDASDLASRLQEVFAPLAPTLLVWAGEPGRSPALPATPPEATSLVYWRHTGAGPLDENEDGSKKTYFSEVVREAVPAAPDESARAAYYRVKTLGAGVACRLPVKVYGDARGTLPHAAERTEWSDATGLPELNALNRSTRLADVALSWGVTQHFYPYFDVVEADWDAALPAALAKAATDPDEVAFLGTLRDLIAHLHDGHGYVEGPVAPVKKILPLMIGWAGKELVITGKVESVPASISVGDVIVSIDGKPTATCFDEVSPHISAATESRRRFVSRYALASMSSADPVLLRLRHPDGTEYEVPVDRMDSGPIHDVTAERPENGAELSPGIVYFDLDWTSAAELRRVLPDLIAARGIVFDLRGYPSDAAMQLLPHLVDQDALSARWGIPIVTLPDRESFTEWDTDGRWSVQPAAPRLLAAVAFLTDARAISAAETVMGIVEAYRLGEIVGAATAGTNGNINQFALPGGYTVTWTGMRTLKHDGTQHHGIGILPTVPVEPTPVGIAEGRDEVLARAVEVLEHEIVSGITSK